ncbi:MAG TPA: hypothetical protein PKD86_10950 [Gemmatales bacterium]|nr:hypothetical protein [Gemmatales bacterium]HMP59862.1 hypothetical protein [Gemmatales bacterium]
MAARKRPKTAVVAFKVESQLAAILNELPNKSAFIRKAIIHQLDMACPMCRGSGVLPKGLHDHFAPLIAQLNTRPCDACGTALPLQAESPELRAEDRSRLEQFFHGGPFYCEPCYDKAPPCHDCGWHIAADEAKRHHRQLHDV